MFFMKKSDPVKKKRKKRKLTIRSQMACIFIAVMAGVIILCWVINSAYLEKYYVWSKEQSLLESYMNFNEAANDNTLSSDEFNIEWQKICNKYNINVIILDADSKTVLCSSNEVNLLMRQLLDYFFGNNISHVQKEIEIVKEENNYTLQIVQDPRMKTEYVELWGILDNGNPFLIRSAVEGIRDSVDIANQFLVYAGILAIILGSIAISIATKRIAKPVLELANISEKMAHLDFDARYKGDATVEIELLGKNINELSAALEETISELKTANNELKTDIEKKEKIDEMRKEFLSNVSHELKTPIALIQGYAEGLKEDINEDPESKDFYCDVIIDESTKMNNMVKKLLTLNQLEFGNDPITMERFDIMTLIRNYVQASDILIKQNEATVHIEGPEFLFVWSDEFKVEEVFMNYFSNALNHLSRERIIDVKITKNDKNVRISVFNTGEPIPEECIEHLWEKFYKVDKARTREYGGSGVGLSIVKAIMESLHQNYGVTNYDNGVEFWMELDTFINIENTI